MSNRNFGISWLTIYVCAIFSRAGEKMFELHMKSLITIKQKRSTQTYLKNK